MAAEWREVGTFGLHVGGNVGSEEDAENDLGFGKIPHALLFWEETQFTAVLIPLPGNTSAKEKPS